MIIFRQGLSILCLPLLFVLCALGAMQSATAQAATTVIYVDGDASGSSSGVDWANACNTISAGLTASASGDEVRVAERTYSEVITLKSGVALYGGYAGSGSIRDITTYETIIDASTADGGSPADHVVVMDTITGSRLDGFTITGGVANGTFPDNFGGGIYCNSVDDTNTVENCTITGNSATYYGGGVFCYRSSPTLTNCTITGNSADYSAGGVYCSPRSNPTLTNCTITGNSATDNGGGVYCSSSSNPTLTNCTITGNEADYGGGVYCWYSSPTLTNCILWNQGTEIGGSSAEDVQVTYSCVQGGWAGTGNIDAYPQFVDEESGDYYLENGSPCVDRGLVSVAPSTDKDGQPRPGGDGFVDMGAYESPDSYLPGPASHTARILRVRSEAPEGGDGSSWENAFSTISEALEVCSVSDEVWVAGGRYGESIALEPTAALYGGFAATETLRVERNWTANETTIDATGLNSSAVLGANFATLDGFTVTGGNASDGGGVYCRESSPTLTNCTITGNSAAGDGGGVYCYESSPTLTNCTITGNSASSSYGGGVYCYKSSPTLTNCTITGNSATYGGVYCSSSYPTLTNCILWNQGTEIGGSSAEDVQVTYSCVQGGWRGTGNIDAYPRFVDEESGDYHLENGSPCVDRGLVSAAPPTDKDGQPRPGGDALVDMGAYESPDSYLPGPASHTSRILRVRSEAPEGGDGSSWEDAFSTISAALKVCSVSDEVWVAGGIYGESIALEPTVALYGGFAASETLRVERNWTANETIIDATGLNSSAVRGANFATLDGFTVTGGNAYYGGGVSCWYSSPTLTNCTITGNEATGTYSSYIYVGGVSCSSSDPTLTNCILWNPGEEIHGSASVTYSCLEGGYTGTGNISSDPSFVHPWDGETADLHLLADSPCIDSGTTVASVTTDIEGNPRPNGAGYDMGAYEYYPPGYETPTPTNAPTFTITPTDTPTNTPTETFTSTPTDTFTTTWTPTETPTDTPTATLTSTHTPTDTLTETLTSTPSDMPTDTPTVTPTGQKDDCDLNGDGKVDSSDLLLFIDMEPKPNFGGDSDCDHLDWFEFCKNWGQGS